MPNLYDFLRGLLKGPRRLHVKSSVHPRRVTWLTATDHQKFIQREVIAFMGNQIGQRVARMMWEEHHYTSEHDPIIDEDVYTFDIVVIPARELMRFLDEMDGARTDRPSRQDDIRYTIAEEELRRKYTKPAPVEVKPSADMDKLRKAILDRLDTPTDPTRRLTK